MRHGAEPYVDARNAQERHCCRFDEPGTTALTVPLVEHDGRWADGIETSRHRTLRKGSDPPSAIHGRCISNPKVGIAEVGCVEVVRKERGSVRDRSAPVMRAVRGAECREQVEGHALGRRTLEGELTVGDGERCGPVVRATAGIPEIRSRAAAGSDGDGGFVPAARSGAASCTRDRAPRIIVLFRVRSRRRVCAACARVYRAHGRADRRKQEHECKECRYGRARRHGRKVPYRGDRRKRINVGKQLLGCCSINCALGAWMPHGWKCCRAHRICIHRVIGADAMRAPDVTGIHTAPPRDRS